MKSKETQDVKLKKNNNKKQIKLLRKKLSWPIQVKSYEIR